MAKRKFKLTWQKGASGRPGRWRKVIGGKAYYFDGGSGKSDRVAYKAAVAKCEKLKSELSVTHNPHRAEYLETIGEWKAVAIWCKENGNEKLLPIAEKKISTLSGRLEKGSKCTPLAREDKFVTEPEWKYYEEGGAQSKGTQISLSETGCEFLRRS